MTLLSVAVVVTVGWWLAAAVGVGRATAATAVGAGLVGALVRLAGSDRLRLVAVAAAWVTALPAGGLLFTGTVVVSASQFAGTVPVGTVFLVGGVGVATLGATGIPGRRVGRDQLSAAAQVVLAAAVTLVVTTLLPVADSVVTRETGVVPAATLFGSAGERVSTVFLTPPADPPPVGSFLAAVGGGAVGFARVLRRLPVRVLLDDETDGVSRPTVALDRLLSVLDYGWWLLFLAGPVLVVNVTAPGLVWERVPESIEGPLAAVTTTPAVRAFTLGVVVVAVAVSSFVWLVRAGYRTRLGTRTSVGGAVVGWVASVWFGWRQGGRLAETLATVLADTLPAAATASFRREFDA
ncbi:MAG: hypothetical protein J07HB67_00492, partial [halophilic archaeon J07HB67]